MYLNYMVIGYAGTKENRFMCAEMTREFTEAMESLLKIDLENVDYPHFDAGLMVNLLGTSETEATEESYKEQIQ